jgi:hypothetical protein
MQKFVGYLLLAKLKGTFRAFHFLGVSRGRWFFGAVRFEHVRDPRQPDAIGQELGIR